MRVFPQKRPSRALAAYCDFFKQIRRGVLKISQFPEVLRDQHGTFHKPKAW